MEFTAVNYLSFLGGICSASLMFLSGRRPRIPFSRTTQEISICLPLHLELLSSCRGLARQNSGVNSQPEETPQLVGMNPDNCTHMLCILPMMCLILSYSLSRDSDDCKSQTLARNRRPQAMNDKPTLEAGQRRSFGSVWFSRLTPNVDPL